MLKQMALVMVLAAGTVGLAEAHHAANSQFDGNKTLEFTGVLQRVQSGNPHGYVYFVRTMPNSQQENWTFETDAINALRRAGLSVRNDLKVGTTYTLVYSPALDGSNAGQMTGIKLSDGRVITFNTKNIQNETDKLLKSPQSGQSPQ